MEPDQPRITRSPGLPGSVRGVLALFALLPGLVAAGLFLRVDAHALGPGPAEDVSRLIKVSRDTPASKGAFLLTTVSVSFETINVFEAVRAAVDPAIETIPRDALVEPGRTDEQQDQINQADMEESKYNAIVVAAVAAGLPVSEQPGARVIKVFTGMPAAGKLQDGDVVVSAGGEDVRSVKDLTDAIRAGKVGATIELGVLRGSRRLSVEMRTTSDPAEPNRPLIGVRLAPAFRMPVEVTIDSNNIVGPSAGLMFTLAIADALTDDDLTGGHRIAGTGTIGLDGSVGRIGGVAQKVRAAEYAGAEVFLSPAEDFPEARRAARSIRVLSVRDIAQAVELLQGLPAASRD